MRDPICEPIAFRPGRRLLVDLNRVSDASPDPDLFFHFHDVAELVLFGHDRIDGHVYFGDRRFRLRPGSLVFLPSMQPHGFDIRRGRRNRLLVQFDPGLVEDLGSEASGMLGGACCWQPDTAMARRLDMLGLWLLDLSRGSGNEAARQDVLRLLLRCVADAVRDGLDIAAEAGQTPYRPAHRLAPVIQALHRYPEHRLTLTEAASMCSVSPEHFSRLFRRAFGLPFIAYRKQLSLRFAAQLLVQNDQSIAQIGYATGFSNPSHFIAGFREQFGMTPRAYRKAHEDWRDGAEAQPAVPGKETPGIVDWSRLAG